MHDFYLTQSIETPDQEFVEAAAPSVRHEFCKRWPTSAVLLILSEYTRVTLQPRLSTNVRSGSVPHFLQIVTEMGHLGIALVARAEP
jgi:hypothetical protein